MKKLLDAGGLEGSDIAFYFVHWITDLAGAVPTPMAGMEKFVLKFPVHVLVSFVSSMGLVQRLATTPPAKLFLDFLIQSWAAAGQKVKAIAALDPPSDAEGWRQRVALMRLVVQGQTTEVQQIIAESWLSLPPTDRSTLGLEMSLTGVGGEPYEPTPDTSVGPAFLVYYSPVFVKIAAHENGVIALRMLAEIYRAARVLWPASAEAAGSSVTIHIGKLRGLKVVDDIATSSYVNGQQWVLVRSSEQEGVVQLDDCEAVLDMVRQGTALTALRFWSSRWDGDLVEPVENSTSMKSSTGGRV